MQESSVYQHLVETADEETLPTRNSTRNPTRNPNRESNRELNKGHDKALLETLFAVLEFKFDGRARSGT